MPEDIWLPKGYELPEGEKVQNLLFYGEEWQIYRTKTRGNVLVVQDRLAEKWFEAKIIESGVFRQAKFGQLSLYTLSSSEEHVLAPVDAIRSPIEKTEALAFALALRESRKLSQDLSFHDAIYVELYSRLLPTWTLSPPLDDKVVLGTWISGGTVISTDSFRRLNHLVKWISPEDLKEVIFTAISTSSIHDDSLQERDFTVSQGKQGTAVDKALDVSQFLSPGSQSKSFILTGRSNLQAFFHDHVIDIIQNAEKYKALGIDFPSGIVLFGPPGSGKTYAVEKLIEFLDWPSFSINSNTVGSPFIHETSKKVSEIFDRAIDASPSLVVIDEMESFLSDRKSSISSSLYHVEEVAEFLRRIPEALSKHVLVIGMTNMLELIDPGILRRGRFDHIVEVGMLSKGEVETLISELLSKVPVERGLDISELVDTLVGRPISDSTYVVREAARLAAKERKDRIDQLSLLSALTNLSEKKEDNKGLGFVWG